MKSIFGPVPSRRLGRSLGIDVIPPKTCSYDCVYCESGPTTHLSLRRQSFVDPAQVIRELEEYFSSWPQGADVLTFSSGGEPTLYEPLGELLRSIKQRFSRLPLVVLTNGSLLSDRRVRRDLSVVDRVVPSLDAVTAEIFQQVNRPHPLLDILEIIEGLRAFRREYRGQLHLEVALVSGLNDGPEELKRIAGVVEELSPDRVELNTVVRPPAVQGICGLTGEEMKAASAFFPCAITQIVGQFRAAGGDWAGASLDQRILELVQRRPCTVAEMAASLGARPEELQAALLVLQEGNRIARYIFDDREYLVSGISNSGGSQCSN